MVFLVGLSPILLPTASDKVGVAATWWNDCIFYVRGLQGDSERHASIYCLSVHLSFPSLCWLHTLKHSPRKCATIWACTSVSLNGPVDIVQKRLRACVCVCTCVWCKTLTISARRGFPPGPHPVHCHSQSSNLWGQRLFCHRLSFTVAHELPLLPLNGFSEITKSKDNSVLHIFSFVISVRPEHVVFLFVASQYGHFLKEPFRHGRHHVAGSLNWFKWWHLLLFRKVLYYLNICYSSRSSDTILIVTEKMRHVGCCVSEFYQSKCWVPFNTWLVICAVAVCAFGCICHVKFVLAAAIQVLLF